MCELTRGWQGMVSSGLPCPAVARDVAQETQVNILKLNQLRLPAYLCDSAITSSF